MPRDEPRVASAFGRRGREPEPEEFPAAVLPPIQLPPVRLLLEPQMDEQALAGLFDAVRAGIYAATRAGLADAVRDFADEQEAAAAEQGTTAPG